MMKKMLVAGAAFATILAAPAAATIVSGTLTGGNYQPLGGTFIITNAALTPNIGVDSINMRNTYGLNERNGVALTAADNRWYVDTLAAGIERVDIGIGTKVASHLVFIDPPAIPNPGSASGTVTFATKILGYVWKKAELDSTNGLLGATGVTYGLMAPLETSNDFISFNGKVLTYSFSSTASTADMIRVITAVPDAETWALLVIGFGMIGAVARRRKPEITA